MGVTDAIFVGGMLGTARALGDVATMKSLDMACGQRSDAPLEAGSDENTERVAAVDVVLVLFAATVPQPQQEELPQAAELF